MVFKTFHPYEHVLAGLFRKLKLNFPRLYCCRCLCYNFEILKKQQSFSELSKRYAQNP